MVSYLGPALLIIYPMFFKQLYVYVPGYIYSYTHTHTHLQFYFYHLLFECEDSVFRNGNLLVFLIAWKIISHYPKGQNTN